MAKLDKKLEQTCVSAEGKKAPRKKKRKNSDGESESATEEMANKDESSIKVQAVRLHLHRL